MENNKLKGMDFNPNEHLFKIMLESCLEKIKLNPELIILYDLESGMPYTATEEERDFMNSLWESCKPKNIPLNQGYIFIFGTGGEIDKQHNENFNDFFK